MQEALVSSMAIHQRKHNYNLIKSYPLLCLRHALLTPKTHTHTHADPVCVSHTLHYARRTRFLRHTCTGTSPFTFAWEEFWKKEKTIFLTSFFQLLWPFVQMKYWIDDMQNSLVQRTSSNKILTNDTSVPIKLGATCASTWGSFFTKVSTPCALSNHCQKEEYTKIFL